MPKASRPNWPIWLAVAILIAALIGFTITAGIVQSEGWDGLWKRKRDFIEGTQPELKPALDEAEKQVLGTKPKQEAEPPSSPER